MGYIADVTRHYFATTTVEQRRKDWESLKKYNHGPNILDVINNYGRGTQVPIPLCNWNSKDIASPNTISSSFNDSELCLAA